MGKMSEALQRWFPGAYEQRADPPTISMADWHMGFRPGTVFTYNGQPHQGYYMGGGSQGGYYYGSNSAVFACTANRMLLFSEARYQFQQMVSGRPGDLFGTSALAVLEEPWPGASTGELQVQAELDITMHGNSYWVPDGPYLMRLDPCRMRVLTEGVGDAIYGRTVGERLLAYAYEVDRDTIVPYLPGEIAHYHPYPDPNNRFVGMSWLNPCLDDVNADVSVQRHKVSSLDSGAKIPMVVTLNGVNGRGPSPVEFQQFVDIFRREHEGADKAGRTLFLGPGSDVKTIGQTFENLEMKATQGAGETRIAACAGVPPVIVGFSEGLSSATYSNYSQARRRLVDGTMRPLWRCFAAALQSIVPPPSGSRLWYDDRDIPFLREDVTDQAEILAKDAATTRQLVDAGFDPDAVIEAVKAGDLSRLKGKHGGLFSVQLQPPGTEAPTPTPAPVN